MTEINFVEPDLSGFTFVDSVLWEDIKQDSRLTSKRCKDPLVPVINRSDLTGILNLHIMYLKYPEIPQVELDVITLTQFAVDYCRNHDSSRILIDSPSSSKVIKIEGVLDFCDFTLENLDKAEIMEKRGHTFVQRGRESRSRRGKNVRPVHLEGSVAWTLTSEGNRILVDSEDQDILEAHSWSCPGRAVTTTVNSDKITLSNILKEHWDIRGATWKHLNGDRFDFRRENLEIAKND
ncbi:hypothetical protein AHIS2_p036 [Acaryochloris phage A-HIS2]|nr:hypothetical protein AHIS2_p036 [Acaryochloris phage A-HIS2]